MRPNAKLFFDSLVLSHLQSRWFIPLYIGLDIASILYTLLVYGRNLIFDLGLIKIRRLPVPVIGVGNLTVGGTGKTPLVIEIVQALLRLGIPSAVISRGYKRLQTNYKDKVTLVSLGKGPIVNVKLSGDEPMLLARRLPVPVAVGSNRFMVGKAVLDCCGPRVLVGDDLFQHRYLYRDFDIIVLDSRDPLSNGKLLPCGLLRESASELRRASIIILTHANQPKTVKKQYSWLRNFWGNGPILACRHRQIGLVNSKMEPIAREKWQGKSVLAFCGLASSDSFAEGIRELGLKIITLELFSNHHFYSFLEIKRLWEKAYSVGAAALVTSEKDAMRLPSVLPNNLNLWLVRLELVFDDGNQTLDRILAWGLSSWRNN